MHTPKPTRIFINFTRTLFTFLTLFTHTLSNRDFEVFEKRIALDIDIMTAKYELGDYKLSKTDVFRKAQSVLMKLDGDDAKRVIRKNEFVSGEDMGSSTTEQIGFPVIQSLVVNKFYIGEGTNFDGVPTKMVTVRGALTISVSNPSNSFGIHVSAAPINLLYSEITIATGQKKYYQPRKSDWTLEVSLKGTNVFLYGAGSSLAALNKLHIVPLSLEFPIWVQGDDMKLMQLIQVSCSFVFNSSYIKPIVFRKDSCIYN